MLIRGQIPVDHFGNATAETYQNRYWVNGTYYKPGGPVFGALVMGYDGAPADLRIHAVFDAGEGDAEPFVSALEVGRNHLPLDVADSVCRSLASNSA
jgi:hypothetical protein